MSEMTKDEEIQAILAGLGDDAALMRNENGLLYSPEIADNMDAAADLIEELQGRLGQSAPVAVPAGWVEVVHVGDRCATGVRLNPDLPYPPDGMPLYLAAAPAAPQPAQSGWIKCSERMPTANTGEQILCFSIDHTGSPYVTSCAYWDDDDGPKGFQQWDDSMTKEKDHGIIPDVTHWMPLPAPPIERLDREGEKS